MRGSPEDFSNQYAAALEDYLTGAGEIALRNAYELGRQALEYESGLLIVSATYHQALQTILIQQNPQQENSGYILTKAAEFLSESLSPFEMAQRGFQSSIASLHNLNESLSRQKRDLHLLLSPMPNLLLSVDHHDSIAAFFIPPTFAHILKDCEVGMHIADVLPDEFAPRIIQGLNEVRQSQPIHRCECSLRLNGKTLYFDGQISPVSDSDDVLVMLNDITERKEIQLAEQRQRILTEALREIAIVLNSSLDVNEILNRIIMSAGQVVPHDMANIMLIEQGVAHIVRSFGYAENGLANYEKSISKLKISAKKTPTIYQVIKSKQAMIVADLSVAVEQRGYGGLGLSGSVVSTPILIGGLVIGLINLNSLKPNSFTALDVQNIQIFANQAAVAIQNARLFNHAQETAMLKERQRLARELHDAVSQSLFAASSITESLVSMWNRKPDEAFKLVRDLEQLIKSIKAEMRVLLWELRPENLVANPLDKLLAQLVDSVQARTKIIIRHDVQEIRQLPEDVHITFYRITQEALNNIIKHSHASEGSVQLYLKVHQTVLCVRDNGRGFNLDETSSGFGLGNMLERAQSIKAVLEVVSQPGMGTEITVTWEDPKA